MNALISKIRDSSKWPDFENSKFLDDLDSLANDASNLNTLEGYLAALAIYHQLCDEMAKLLIRDSEFFIQLSCYPTEINFPKTKQQMAGQTLSQLESAVEFAEKEDFINKCKEMNSLRNKVFHNLTKQPSLEKLKIEVNQISSLYQEIYNLFDESHDWFKLCFKDFKKDSFGDITKEDLLT